MTHFTMLVPPEITHKDGSRTAKAGTFRTHARIDKSTWLQMKAAGAWYVSDEEDEDGIGVAGWNYPVKSLVVFIKSGQAISLEGIECKTVKELFDAIESLPSHRRAQEQQAQDTKSELESERVECVRRASESGLKECFDWSWDDFGYSVRATLAETTHFIAREYWTTRTPDLAPGEVEKRIGFVINKR